MRVWLAEGFWDSVRRLFRQEADLKYVEDILNEYANAGNDRQQIEAFEKSKDMKRMKGCSFVKKFRFQGYGISLKATRIICIPLDRQRAELLSNANAGLSPQPQSGDSLVLCVALHDLQGPEASRLEQRFRRGSTDVFRIEPFPPLARNADPAVERKLTVIKNAGLYVSKTPFNTYRDYEVWVKEGDAKLSDKQFDILQAILGEGNGAPSPFFVTGCAGSGKTLLAATVLNLLPSQKGLPNVYFVLSKRLCGETADQTVRIALSKLRWDASKEEVSWIDNYLASQDGSVFGDRLSPKAIADRASADGIASVAEAMRDLPAFKTLNEHLFEALADVPALSDIVCGRTFEEAFIDDARFRRWFRQTQGDLAGSLRAPDVWTEIKGVIKGYLGAAKALKIDEARHWNWGDNVFPVGQRERDLGASPGIAGRVWSVLERHGNAQYAGTGATGFRRLLHADADSVATARDEIGEWAGTDRENGLACLDEILKSAGFGDCPEGFVDFRKVGLTQEEYLGLPPAQSIHDADTRKRIYQIYRRYEEWKRNEGLVDGNDLARIAAALYSNSNQDHPFGTVVVDECQDFTEMQLLAMKKLGRNENGMILAGDQHQMINPTFFDPDRMQALFPLGDGRLQVCHLSFNYRNTREIAEFSNRIAHRRREWIGARGLAGEQDERSEGEGDRPDFWAVGPNEQAAFLERQLEDPTFRILVYDDKDRDAVVDLARDQQGMRDRVVTIRECKGLEFKKVLCYNLLGRYPSEWAKIRAGEVKHDERYRYFFNSVYVAATRSLSRLGFLERDEKAFRDNPWLSDDRVFWRTDIPADAWPTDKTRRVQDAIESGDQNFERAEDSENPEEKYEIALRFYRRAEEWWSAKDPVDMTDIRKRIASAMLKIAGCRGENSGEAVKYCLRHGGSWLQTDGETPLERLYENRKAGKVFDGMDEGDIKTVFSAFSKPEDRGLLDEFVQLQAIAVSEGARDLVGAVN